MFYALILKQLVGKTSYLFTDKQAVSDEQRTKHNKETNNKQTNKQETKSYIYWEAFDSDEVLQEIIWNFSFIFQYFLYFIHFSAFYLSIYIYFARRLPGNGK